MRLKKGTTEQEVRTPAARKAKRPPVFVYMMYLLVATVVCTGVTLSSYISTVSGGDEARVAKFDVDTDGLTTLADVTVAKPGDMQTFEFAITNNSEVAVRYHLQVENLSGNLPLEFIVDQDQPEKQKRSTYTFEQVLAPGTEKTTYILTVLWPAQNAEDRNPSYAGKTDVLSITVTANQED